VLDCSYAASESIPSPMSGNYVCESSITYGKQAALPRLRFRATLREEPEVELIKQMYQ